MTHPFVLSERDVRSFLREAPSMAGTLKRLGSTAAIGAGFLLIAFVAMNFSSLVRLQSVPSQAEAKNVAATTPTPAPSESAAAAVPTATPTPAPQFPSIPSDSLSIGDLAISAPVHWDTTFDDKVIHEQLESGIVHLAGTAKPGQTGMVVITGHSSNYPWDPGLYNSVFAPLHKAVVGQQILVNYENAVYEYKVTKIYKVNPDNLSVLETAKDGSSGLRLITCTPIGFTWQRLIVEAVQVTPDQGQNQPFQQANFTGSLPTAK